MNQKFKCLLFILVFVLMSNSVQAQIKISGIVRDSLTAERLIGAHIMVVESGKGQLSDNQGYFSISVSDNQHIQISYVGYQSKTIKVSNESTFMNVLLQEQLNLEEVKVLGRSFESIQKVSFKSSEIDAIPALGAMQDVLKSIEMMPGIHSQNEGSSRILVRGGSFGQNLFLIDDVPLIHVHHLGGFYSVFNTEMIAQTDLYKNAFPSKFGGKLSSVVAMTQREGNQSKKQGTFSIGLTDLSFSLEGPTKLKNSSFIVTGRKTLIDALMLGFTALSDANPFLISYGFHDINTKFSWNPNPANSFHLSFYMGDDYLLYARNEQSLDSRERNRLSNVWGNIMLNARWNLVKNNWHGTNIASFTRYRLSRRQTYEFQDNLSNLSGGLRFKSSINDYSYRTDWKYFINDSFWINAGGQISFLDYLPSFNEYQRPFDNNSLILSSDIISTLETSAFSDFNFNLLNRIEGRVGTRVSHFMVENFSQLYLEPRIFLSFKTWHNHSVNIAAQRVNQFNHLLFTGGDDIFNTDLWIPANSSFIPSTSDQISLGYNAAFLNNEWEASAEAYFKELRNLTTYREGFTNLLGDPFWERKLISGGIGRSQGIEFLLRKRKGKWQGFAAYTWSNTVYQFDEINNGNEYVFEFDRPHSFNMHVNYILSKKWSFGANWMFQSGLPFTPALGRQNTLSLYDFDASGIGSVYSALHFGERNSARMEANHRLDLGATLKTKTKRRGLPAEWTFSIYNVYNRQNPYYYYYNNRASPEFFRPEDGYGDEDIKLFSVAFLPIIPSVSYKVYFDFADLKKRNKEPINQRIKKLLYYD